MNRCIVKTAIVGERGVIEKASPIGKKSNDPSPASIIENDDENIRPLSNTSATLVQLTAVDLFLNQQKVLSGIDLEIEMADFLTIIGPNGAGKSSLLRVISGFLSPGSGQVWRSPNLQVGYVPQTIQHNPTMPMRVMDFLRIGTSPLQRHSPLQQESSHKKHSHFLDNLFPDDLLKRLRIESLYKKYLTDLSGGQLQRVLMARALQREPDLLLLDEPTQGLDFDQQDEFYKMIDLLHESRSCAIVVVSHDLHFVAARSKHIICLNGHICCQGDSQSVLQNRQKLEEMGLGALCWYHHRHDHHHSI